MCLFVVRTFLCDGGFIYIIFPLWAIPFFLGAVRSRVFFSFPSFWVSFLGFGFLLFFFPSSFVGFTGLTHPQSDDFSFLLTTTTVRFYLSHALSLPAGHLSLLFFIFVFYEVLILPIPKAT